MADYEVLRAHWGERGGARHRFAPGEVRALPEGDALAAVLLRRGIIAPWLPQLDHDGDGRPGGSLPRDDAK